MPTLRRNHGPLVSWRLIMPLILGVSCIAGCGSDQADSPTNPKASVADPSTIDEPVSVAKTPLQEVIDETERELNRGFGRFRLDVVKELPSPEGQVSFRGRIVFELPWERTDVGFMAARDGGSPFPVELALDGKPIAGAFDNVDISKITIRGKSIEEFDSDRKLVYSGDQSLLDLLGWPKELPLESWGNSSETLKLQSKRFTTTFKKRDQPEDGFSWAAVELNHEP